MNPNCLLLRSLLPFMLLSYHVLRDHSDERPPGFRDYGTGIVYCLTGQCQPLSQASWKVEWAFGFRSCLIFSCSGLRLSGQSLSGNTPHNLLKNKPTICQHEISFSPRLFVTYPCYSIVSLLVFDIVYTSRHATIHHTHTHTTSASGWTQHRKSDKLT